MNALNVSVDTLLLLASVFLERFRETNVIIYTRHKVRNYTYENEYILFFFFFKNIKL